jgi:CarD family transcriptional regulator
LSGPVTIEITFGFPDSKRRDVDSLKKPILSALARFGVIENDSAKIVRDLQLHIGVGFIGTRIEVAPHPIFAYRVGECVRTAKGVGRISGIERHEIKGVQVELLVIQLPNARLLVPRDRVEDLRPLASSTTIANALAALGTKPRSLRKSWLAAAPVYRRRLQSGDPVVVATVVRDLYGSLPGTEATTFFENALKDLAGEVAAVEEITTAEATYKIQSALGRPPFARPGKAS